MYEAGRARVKEIRRRGSRIRGRRHISGVWRTGDWRESARPI